MAGERALQAAVRRRRPVRWTTLSPRIYRLIRPLESLPQTLLDAGIVVGAYVVALVLALEGNVPVPSTNGWVVLGGACVPLTLHLLANHLAGLYGPVWRYASVSEAGRIIVAVLAGALASAVTLLLLGELTEEPVPVAMFPIAGFIVLLGSGGIRFQARLFALRSEVDEGGRSGTSRVIVAGAGASGAALVSEIQRNPGGGMEIVGFVDDDPRKARRSVRNVAVLGTTADLPSLCRQHVVDRIVIAIPSATSSQIRQILDYAYLTDARIQVLPPLRELLEGPTLRSVRDINIADLLGRDQIEIDLSEVRGYLEGAVVLVTGAGGSIGGEIARQVSTFGPRRLLVLDHDETHLHDLLADGRVEAEALLADVCDAARIESTFRQHKPDVVFHAAAHKHVPILQANPGEAVKTNILGTRNVVEAAVANGCERFILISTDKAASPQSVMGASKRAAELIVQRTGCDYGVRFAAVRFGNVVGSRGSVVPTFMQQILSGGPVTLTHPDMTRYFMSTSEAVALVLQAGALASWGDILTLDMGKQVRIADLATQMIRLAGLRPGIDIELAVTGMRPGERLIEQLCDDGDVLLPTEHPSILRLPSQPELPATELTKAIDRLSWLASNDAAPDATTTVLDQLLRDAGVCSRLDANRRAHVSLVDAEQTPAVGAGRAEPVRTPRFDERTGS